MSWEHLFAAPPDVESGADLSREGFVRAAEETNRAHLCEALLDDFDPEAHERRPVELAVRHAKGNPMPAGLLGLTRGQLSYRLRQDATAAE